MKLYLTHSSGYDYQAELYEPLKTSLAKDYDIFFPHDEHNDGTEFREIIAGSDVILAEVSYPSTGEGIELGRADASGTPIICFYRSGSKFSSALGFICDTFVEYDSKEDMIEKLRLELNRYTKS